MNLNETIDQRDRQYGGFENVATTSQSLKAVMMKSGGKDRLTPEMRESLEMIQHKIARILNGDPFYADNWHDIAGYAQLIERMLERMKKTGPTKSELTPSVKTILDENYGH